LIWHRNACHLAHLTRQEAVALPSPRGDEQTRLSALLALISLYDEYVIDPYHLSSAVSNGVRIQKQGKSRTAIWPCPSTQGTSQDGLCRVERRDSELANYSVCTTSGLIAQRMYLIDVFRRKLNFPDLKRSVRQLADLHHVDVVLVEDKASSGTSLIQELRGEGSSKVQAAPDN